jgi:3-hydroxybutyryl-CoA dehydratase
MNEYTYAQLEIGHSETFEREITQEMMDDFKKITGDINPLHCDSTFAMACGQPSCVAYGMLTSSFFSTLAGVYLPGKFSLIHRVEIDFRKPVYVGDKLKITGVIKDKSDVFKTIELKVTIENQNNIKVCSGKMRIGFTEI